MEEQIDGSQLNLFTFCCVSGGRLGAGQGGGGARHWQTSISASSLSSFLASTPGLAPDSQLGALL